MISKSEEIFWDIDIKNLTVSQLKHTGCSRMEIFLCVSAKKTNIYWSISSSVQVWYDDVLDEPLVREDQVVAVGVEEYELAGLVEGPQAYPVLEVDRRLP